MKTFSVLLLVAGLALVATPALAQAASLDLTSESVGGVFHYTGNGQTTPFSYHVEPGAEVTVKITHGSGADDTAPHNFKVGDKQTPDVENAGDSQTLTFTAPTTGSVTGNCIYHTTMSVTFTTAAAGTEEKKSPGVQVLGVVLASIAGALLLIRRK